MLTLNWRVWVLAFCNFLLAAASGLFNLFLVVHFAVREEFSTLGYVLMFRTLPIILVAMWGGAVADRFNKVKIGCAALFVTGIINFFTVLVATSASPISYVFALSMFSGLASSFGAPSLYALLPQITANGSLFAANALVRSLRNLGSIITPLLYALLALVGGSVAGYFASVLYAIGGLVLLTLLSAASVERQQTTASAASLQDIREDSDAVSGRVRSFSKLLRSYIDLLAKYKAVTAAIIFWLCFLPLQEALVDSVLPSAVISTWSEDQWLTIAALLSAGYIAGSIFANSYEIKNKNLLALSVLFFFAPAVQMLLFITTESLALLLLTAPLVGFALELSGVCWGTYMQSTVAEKDLGKVSAFDYAASFGFVPVGYAIAGTAMGVIGVAETLRVGTQLLAIGTFVAIILLVVAKIMRLAKQTKA